MAENYKHLYKQMKKMVTVYQDFIVPNLNKIIEDLKKNRVEVVRCANCIHFGAEAAAIDAWTPICLKHKISVFPSDYCSYGERKDNG